MADFASVQLPQAIETTLQGSLKTILGGEWAKATWKQTNEYPHATECPIVSIVASPGFTVVSETMRGEDEDGNPVSGWQQREYTYEIQVYLRGRKTEDRSETARKWLDGIAAILTDDFSLDGLQVDVQVETSMEPETVPIESGTLSAGAVRATVQAWVVQGETELG